MNRRIYHFERSEKSHAKGNEEIPRVDRNDIQVHFMLLQLYIDESVFSKDMPRIFGYASVGMRCFGKYDSMSKRRTNGIVALIKDRLLTVAIFDYSINTEVFEAWH